MKSMSYTIAVVILITGCGSLSKSLGRSDTSSKDSEKLVLRDRIVYQTVYADLPEVKESNTTRDTSSHLENDYAKSDATVSNGELCHTLETKPQKIPTTATVVVRDTIYIREKADTIYEEKIVEVDKPLSGWVKFWRNLGYISGLALILLAVVKIVSNRTKVLTSIKNLLSL